MHYRDQFNRVALQWLNSTINFRLLVVTTIKKGPWALHCIRNITHVSLLMFVPFLSKSVDTWPTIYTIVCHFETTTCYRGLYPHQIRLFSHFQCFKFVKINSFLNSYCSFLHQQITHKEIQMCTLDDFVFAIKSLNFTDAVHSLSAL